MIAALVRKACLALLVMVWAVAGCIGPSPPIAEPTPIVPTVAVPSASPIIVPTATQISTPALAPAVKLRTGVYATNDLAALPLPASGYDVYVVGELVHGTREVALLTLAYLEILHEAIGLCDVILEGGPGFEKDVNQYILGRSEAISDLWYRGRSEILDGVRAMNEKLPDNEKIRLHFIDVHGVLSTIHAYLQDLQREMGAAAEYIQIPSLSEFEEWSQAEMLALADELMHIAEDDEHLVNGVATVKSSIRFHFAWEGFERGEIPASVGQAIREERIALNMQHLLEESDDAPVLALYGGWHTQKSQGMRSVIIRRQPVVLDVQPWAQRLTESGVAIYSVLVGGISGFAKPVPRGTHVYADPKRIDFADGTTLATFWDAGSEYNVVHVDLRSHANASARFREGFTLTGAFFDPDIPAGEIYDGIVLFTRVGPVQW